MDALPPKGPHRSLAELSEDESWDSIQRQNNRWLNHGLDPEWLELLVWYVRTRKDSFSHWPGRWHWDDAYWPAGGELDYKAWFEALVAADSAFVRILLQEALNACYKKEYQELRGPLRSANPYTITGWMRP